MEVSLLTGGSERTLETVKVLHETVLALRTALEGSRREILELRSQNRISAELQPKKDGKGTGSDVPRRIFFLDSMDGQKEEEEEEKKTEDAFGLHEENKLDSGAESDDIDDIELVFTTGETDPSSIHEDLVPIVEETVGKSTTNTVVVETDISKCGVIDENEINLCARRNTLPNPLPYQPIIHREILAAARIAPARSPYKALQPGTQDMGAQTDITALPAHWKSETYLAHKMACNLTTLPSKFTLPVPQVKRLPLSDKTREARRVLLSDINFTSMVPELSRSADHLHDEKTSGKPPTSGFDYGKSPRTGKCCEYTRQESRSSCGSYYGSRCHTSSTSIPPFACEEARRRHSWRPPQIVCCHSRQIWSSVPSSPVKCHHEGGSGESFCHLPPKKRKHRVHFHHCDPFGQSLPNLRLDADSGDSTDSLIDEAEEFLRRSIDNMILTRPPLRLRERSSDSEFISVSDFEPPHAAQPFLPKTAKELKKDCFVKVITPEGKVAVGRVRYSGLVPGKTEPYVGVELATDSGFSDGSFMGHRFFDCDVDHAVFVPFKKVVIAWSI